MCKMMSNRRYESLMGLLYEAIQEKSPSLPKKCPIKKVNKLILSVGSFARISSSLSRIAMKHNMSRARRYPNSSLKINFTFNV